MIDKPMTWEEAVLWLKEQPGQEALVKACFYDDPLIVAAERYHHSTEWQSVRSHLGTMRGKVLDIGAGRGISSYALAKDGWEVTALEPDSSNIVGSGAIRTLVAESGLNIDITEDWGEELPFEDQTFDLVYGRAVLHHANNLAQLCAEISRVLRNGGMLLATREHVISAKRDLDKFFEAHPLHHLYGGENAYVLSEYIDAIEGAGIELLKVLNPYQSNINLYPGTSKDIRDSIQRKIRLPIANLIPDFALTCLGMLDNTPGRLFSFIGKKK